MADSMNGADDRPACKNCAHHRPAEIIGQRGACAWQPPPVLARLHAALAAEPGTRIDYGSMFEEMPDALARGACGVWLRKVDA